MKAGWIHHIKFELRKQLTLLVKSFRLEIMIVYVVMEDIHTKKNILVRPLRVGYPLPQANSGLYIFIFVHTIEQKRGGDFIVVWGFPLPS